EWNGTYYIAMEYVAGRSLKAIVRENGPLDPEAAIDTVIQILRAARFAHRRGVIHRDLKPHNVILDEEGRARVTDFGIARAGASDMTLTGSIMGTAQYLSPEQAQGYAVTVGSDLYSVGVVLYEVLTGSVPFEGETAVAIAFKQVAAEPRPPSELNPAIPPSLDAIVMRALAKDPAQRYTDADEFIAALERERSELPPGLQAAPLRPEPAVAAPMLGGSFLMAPVLQAPDPVEEEAEQRRRWWWWALAALLVLAAVAAALAIVLSSSKHVRVPDVTGQTEQAALGSLRRAGLTPAPTLASSSTVPVGRVISQTPGAGTKLDEGARVDIAVSEGPGSAPLMNVEGLTAAQASARLKAAGFKPTAKQEASTSVAAGKVIGTEPPAGTETLLGSHVTIHVSSGPAPVKVPDVVGQTQSAAESALSNAGMLTGTVTQQTSSTQSPGTVLSQSPAGGASARAGGKVNLVVAKAPKEVAVPDVIGETEALATTALSEAGLKAKPVSVNTTDATQVGKVLAQTPSAGAHARRGSAVRISIGAQGTSTSTTTTTTPTTTPAPTPPTAAAG
ncbi:MAG TPA: PASTA domain-containing protein, partial [Solirubrobacteraceae bacterium]|nr:PASTA domain-containing protein [Solirubrobacteraceae bacterium]